MKQMPQPGDKAAVAEDASKDAPKVIAVTDLDVDLEKADLPDPQSLSDAIKHWQAGDDAQGAQDEPTGSPWGDGPADSNSASASAKTSAKQDAKKGDAGAKSDGAKKDKNAAKKGSPKASSGKRVSRNQGRRFARQRALQALYQWDVGKVELSDVLNQFKENQNLSNVDLDHFERLFRGVALDVDAVDALLEPALDRPMADLDPVERSILRLSTCELRDCLQTPARVAINEAVELTKRFGADQGHKYVNGVIDKVALVLRVDEMKAGKKG